MASRRRRSVSGAPGSSELAKSAKFIDEVCSWCQRKSRTWRTPPHWSPTEWQREARAVIQAAVCQAVEDYDPSGMAPFSEFVKSRTLNRLLTVYRKEWSYSVRFAPEGSAGPQEAGSALELLGREISDPSLSAPPARIDALREALALLSEPHRHTIEQLFLVGCTESELAKADGLSQRGVSKRKQEGLRLLREHLRSRKLGL